MSCVREEHDVHEIRKVSSQAVICFAVMIPHAGASENLIFFADDRDAGGSSHLCAPAAFLVRTFEEERRGLPAQRSFVISCGSSQKASDPYAATNQV